MNYKICIPSYKRYERMLKENRRTTPSFMGPEIREKTYLCIREEELHEYENVLGRWPELTLQVLNNVTDVVSTRDEILNRNQDVEKLVMIDDDIDFAIKPLELVNGKPKYITMEPAHFERMIMDLLLYCDEGYPIVGITARQFSNNKLKPFEENTRIIQVYCIHMDTWKKEKIYFGDSGQEFASDYYFILEFLARGYKNRVLNMYTRDDDAQAPGGCATYRTAEMHTRSMKKLYKNFPEVVSLRWKNNGTWQEQRLNAMVQWKKAYNLYAKRKG